MNRIILIVKGIQLFPLLMGSLLSKKIFTYAWNKYYMIDLPKSSFNLCVQWLLYVGNKLNLSYWQVNVLIFCIIWPTVTLISIILNIVLLSIIINP